MATGKGVIVRASMLSVNDTINRLQAFLLGHGATIYARINQQSEATRAGQTLYPLEFLLFGNPKVGVPLMAENPLVALDLPLKAMAWQDDEGKVWLAYNSDGYIEDRYSLEKTSNSPLALDRLMGELFKTAP